MAKWTRNKVDPSEINSGNELTANDQVALQEVNAIVNSGLYAQDFAEHMADTPDTSDAGLIGTPNVEIIDNEVNGVTYKKFKFSNLKGELGDFETGTVTTNKVDYTQDVDVEIAKRIDGDTNYLDFTFNIPTDISTLEAELTERVESAEASAISAQASATASATSSSNAEASSNTAVTTSNTALSTAQTAETNSAEAVSTANTALSTAQTAETNSNSAVTTAEEALAKVTESLGTAVYTDGVLLSEWNTEEKAGKIVTNASTGKVGEIFNNYTNNMASGNYSHAEGWCAIASGDYSHAEGYSTTASGSCSHAEGDATVSSNAQSHAEGAETIASNTCAHAEGYLTTASGLISHAEGFYTVADKTYQTAIGRCNITGQTGSLFAVGNGTSASARSTALEVFLDGSIRVNNKYVISVDSDDNLAVAPVDASSSMSISLNGGLITYDADTDTFTI